MELRARKRGLPGKIVSGLHTCIRRDLGLTAIEEKEWQEIKEKGLNLFAPERGGSYTVFNTRPLPDAVLQYCIQDVRFMPKLWHFYQPKLGEKGMQKVQEESSQRVSVSQTRTYNGQGSHKSKAPKSFKRL